MRQTERKELNEALDVLLSEGGDYIGALERLCMLAGRRVAPIISGEPITVLQASTQKHDKSFMPPNTR